MIPFNIVEDESNNEKSITLVIDGCTQIIRGNNPRFEEIFEALCEKNWEKVAELANLALQVVNKSNGLFTTDGDNILIDGEVVVDALGKKIINLADKGLPFEPFIEFWKKLNKNPSHRSVNSLFNFLEHNHVPITEDGCFIAYKGVRENYTDCHTGTVDNSPGTIVKMPRNQVDDNPEHTCSKGLHVAGWNYAAGTAYGGASRYLMIKVSPEHVVSVPVDYDFQKMRVCQYEVIKEVDKPANINIEYIASNGDDYDQYHNKYDAWCEEEDDDSYDDYDWNE